MIEYVILDQLQEFLQRNQVLPDEQSAYGKCGVLILLDLSVAFDTVVHSLLVKDLKNIGVEGEALEHMKDYIERGTYCVQIGNSFSETQNLSSGVPQGSVLGPILFCIYTIELSHILKKHGVSFKLFAVDTQFYLTFNNVDDTVRKLRDYDGN